MNSITFCGILCLALAAFAPSPVGAQTTPQGAAGTPAPDRATAFVARPVDADRLSTFRGGSEARNDMTLSGTTADNSAFQVNTGSNSIGSGAFANMNGLPIVIQNSGANVLIQNAVILHLQMD